MNRLSSAQLEAQADRLLRSSMSEKQLKAEAKREKRADKRQRRYQSHLASNQWNVTK